MDRQTLVAAYQVAHSEKLFSSRAMLQRATLFLAMNSAVLGFVAAQHKELGGALFPAVLGVLFLCNLGWFFVNERNRAYVRYYVDHLARLEHLLTDQTDQQEKEAGPRVFLDMPKFAKGEELRIRPSIGDGEKKTQAWCCARVVRIEKVFSAFGLIFAVFDLGLLLWLVHVSPA